MDMVATQNFHSVDRLLSAPSPQAEARIQALGGRDAARAFLRYQVAEQNRWYFETWECVQIGLGLALFFVLLFGSVPDKVFLLLTLAMLAIVLVMRFFLTPEITQLGRVIDFAAPGVPGAERSRFWAFHGAYSASELGKIGLGLVLVVLLIRRRRRSHAAEIDAVDKSDHSHVNR
jgi:predicted lysophospholipase L1 biosynthesis ABC-type transport system permease subunit